MAAETSITTITTIISAAGALAGVLIGAAVTLRTNTRNIKIENITKERAKWRDKVRKRSLAVHRAAIKADTTALEECHLGFSLILNPCDLNDREILTSIRQLEKAPTQLNLTEFAERIALLLKHDWDRAKQEAKGNDGPFADIDIEPSPKRTAYKDFKRSQLEKSKCP